MIAASFFYIKKQDQDSAKKDQEIKNASAQIESLKKSTSIPEDWKTFILSDSKTTILPNDYKLDKHINGTFLYSSQDDPVKIAVHQYSMPSINYKTFSYDTYCQFNGTSWVAYSNVSGAQTEDKSATALSACKKVTSETSNGVNFYSFEDTEGYSYHLAYVVKVGTMYYVLNYEKYFNGYGDEAIQAMAVEYKKTMTKTVEKIVSANK